MRCRDAKIWLNAQRDGDLELPTDTLATHLQKHLRQCDDCRAFAQQSSSVEIPFPISTAPVQASISTDQIMHAVKKQQYITQQLEELREQQCLRIERIRTIGAMGVALGIFTLSSIPLILLAMLFLQADIVMNILSLLNGVVDVFFILTQYLQSGLTMLAYNNWLLSAVAFAMVVLMGMWLRLMRPPQEA
jgi:predicted anti-sigma-YlaC factor YlaD